MFSMTEPMYITGTGRLRRGSLSDNNCYRGETIDALVAWKDSYRPRIYGSAKARKTRSLGAGAVSRAGTTRANARLAANDRHA
jgi:hypothetical protein